MERPPWASFEFMAQPLRQLIEGRPVIVVIDDHVASVAGLSALVEAARAGDVPIVFADNAATEPVARQPRRRLEYQIRQRRHSVFYGTDLAIILQELNASTVILAGGVTDVGVHYSFVDAHQYDYFCRVAADCMAGSSERAHEAALRAMEYMQTGARRQSGEIIAAIAIGRAGDCRQTAGQS
jgi:nicotinamidase-related amidase